MASFTLGINVAGAISAAAYTAGVLDFLTEALDAWYAAKARGEIVPEHDVVVEVFSGASAGGMCAAISAVVLQQDFEHIQDVEKSGTTNGLFESWVNKIDSQRLLKTEDLERNSSVISLLDCSIIDEMAEYGSDRRPVEGSNSSLAVTDVPLAWGVDYLVAGGAAHTERAREPTARYA